MDRAMCLSTFSLKLVFHLLDLIKHEKKMVSELKYYRHKIILYTEELNEFFRRHLFEY